MSRPLRALVALEHDGESVTAALVRRAGDEAVVERTARAMAADLASGLVEAVAALRAGGRLPRAALLVSGEVAAAGLALPEITGLTAERASALIAWELEPFLPHHEEGEATAPQALACGWASRRREGAPLLVAGLRVDRRDALAGAVAAAGLEAVALYPALGCAAAAVDGADTSAHTSALVLEVGRDRVGVSEVAGQTVIAHRQVRCDAARGPVEAALAAWDERTPLILVGPAAEGTAEALTALGARRVATEAPSGSLLGAARHALGLAGAGDLAAVPAQAPRPAAWTRPRLQLLAGAALAVVAVIGFEARAARRVAALEAERVLLRGEVERARTAAALEEEARRLSAQQEDQRLLSVRRARLPVVLAALARATPDALTVDRLEEDGQQLRVVGFALTDLAVQRLRRDGERALRVHGWAAGEPRLERRRGRLGIVGYGFELRFTREGAPRE